MKSHNVFIMHCVTTSPSCVVLQLQFGIEERVVLRRQSRVEERSMSRYMYKYNSKIWKQSKIHYSLEIGLGWRPVYISFSVLYCVAMDGVQLGLMRVICK